MAGSTPETGKQHLESMEKAPLVVTQPDKYEGLLETISLLDRVTETMGEDRSGDWSGSGSGQSGGTQGDDDAVSQRAQAIANMPDLPAMREKLSGHIKKEVKELRKQMRQVGGKAGKPGNAHKLNQLYAKARRLNSLLSELMDASVDVLKRLYIRIFIDKQSVF